MLITDSEVQIYDWQSSKVMIMPAAGQKKKTLTEEET